ncbi:MAG: hypothetical protein E7641_08500 [Ruminococcaceae bacterium]|nr:hypothetical protein [Oscillospiraceae bacterium]
MLPKKELYEIYPSVVQADKKTLMTIAPLERAFIFVEGAEYSVSVADLNYDEESYYTPTSKNTFSAVAHNGVIEFEYSFCDEQEHLVILEKNGVVVENFYVYSLFEDLYVTRPMKGDFHSHSFRSDGQRDPTAIAGYYREQGYDCFALTDHNRFYSGGEIDEAYEGVNTGFIRVSGEELHTPPSVIHIVHIGGNTSVCEKYFKYPEEYNAEIEEYMKKVPADLPEKYAARYARAMWATDKIHEAGGIAIFPHPYWRPKNLVYNVCDEFAMILLKSGMFDAYEVVGGMKQPDLNRSVALWNELRAEGYDIPVVGSSDVHAIHDSKLFPFNYTIVFAKEKSAEAVVEAIKNGMSVAVEANGNDELTRQKRAYGKLRYVSYAQYLLKYFFPKLERLCEGGGVAMRAYAIGDAPRELVELHAELAERFRLRFFGQLEALRPNADMIAFENKWREVQMNGPLTKGSNIYSTPNRQI